VPSMGPYQASPCWGPIDRRTDVYGLGEIHFKLLNGRPLFVGRRLPDILTLVIGATPVISPTTSVRTSPGRWAIAAGSAFPSRRRDGSSPSSRSASPSPACNRSSPESRVGGPCPLTLRRGFHYYQTLIQLDIPRSAPRS
jgi:hypothetical protein